MVELGPGSPPKWLNEIPGVAYLAWTRLVNFRIRQPSGGLQGILRDEQVDILHTHLFFCRADRRFGKAVQHPRPLLR